MSREWYALRVKAHKEQIVHRQLCQQEVENYFPCVNVQPKNPRAARIRPYFPGYMFVRADLGLEGENAYRWIPGAHGLVRFGDNPATVPENLIYELKRRLRRIEAMGGLKFSRLQKGDRVRIVAGPFAGYEAIFDARIAGKDRVQVLLSLLRAQPKPLKLHVDDVRKIK